MLTIVEVAQRLRVSSAWVYKLISENELPAIRLGKRMALRVEEPALEQFIADRRSRGGRKWTP